MPTNKSAYANLRAEMARRNIFIKDIAACLGKGGEVIGRKLSRPGNIKLNEALQITYTFFPDIDIQELFAEDSPKKL